MDDNDREYVDYDDEDFGPGASLLNANLVGADLAEVFLPQAILMGANLSGADLHEANLNGVNFVEAILYEAGGMLTRFDGNRIDYTRQNPVNDYGILASNGSCHAVVLDACVRAMA